MLKQDERTKTLKQIVVTPNNSQKGYYNEQNNKKQKDANGKLLD